MKHEVKNNTKHCGCSLKNKCAEYAYCKIWRDQMKRMILEK